MNNSDIVVDTFTESKATVTESFAELHQFYLQKSPDKPVIHTYAEPCSSEDGPDWIWFDRIKEERELERYPFKTYIHPDAGWYTDGYYAKVKAAELHLLQYKVMSYLAAEDSRLMNIEMKVMFD